MSKPRCRDCAHELSCGIKAQYKRAWDATYHHLGPDTGGGSSLVQIMDTVAGCCVHYDPARGEAKVLPINPKGRLY